MTTMKIQTACALLAFAPLLGLTSTLTPTNTSPLQDGGGPTTPGSPSASGSQPAEEPSVHFYTTRNVDAYELADIAENLYGRLVDKLDDAGQVTGGTYNVQVLGDARLVIFDTDERAKAILELCKKIDVLEEDLDELERLEALVPVLKSMEYSPRYLSTSDLMGALRPFERQLATEPTSRGAVTSVGGLSMNISMLEQTGSLIIRDTAAALAEISTLLDTIDKPSPQVQLVCYVLRGSKESSDDSGQDSHSIPTEITDNLKRLVPYSSFDLASMGVLRMSTSASRQSNSLRMPGKSEVFEMRLRVGAFDHKDGVLSLDNFEMMKREPMGQENLFATSTSVNAGEYAVMGASGADPVFVVLHFEVIGK